MNVTQFVGSVVVFLVVVFGAYVLLCIVLGLIFLAFGKLTASYRWTPLKHLVAVADERNGRQLQAVYLVPFGRWYGLCLMRETKNVIDRSRPGGREHTSPNAEREGGGT